MKLGSVISRVFVPAGTRTAEVGPMIRRVVAFVHVVGGAGATTMAVNTAYALSQAKARRTCCLIDLDVQFGTAGRLLDLQSASGIELLVDNPDAAESGMLDRLFVGHPSGLQVLTAPQTPVPLHALKRSAIESLIQASMARFPIVVVDLPVAVTSWTDIVLRAANEIYLVTPMTVPAAYNVLTFFKLLEDHDLDKLPVRVVVNRKLPDSKKEMVSADKFRAAIRRPIDHMLPEEFETVQRSHNEGRPVVALAPRCRFSRAIGEIASEILRNSVAEGPAQPTATSLRGW